jgi:thiamine-phosphate pyrophosphorylase
MVISDPGARIGVIPAVEAALRGGATAIQVRWKEAAAGALLELARALRAPTRAAGALLLVNDRVDVALAADADGAHLGDDDLPLSAARRIVPPTFVLGRSVDTPAQAIAAQREGADYVGLGPVFSTRSKHDIGPVLGEAGVGEVSRAVSVPIVAIGGIAVGRAGDVIRAGADGVAALSALMSSVDPETDANRMIREVLLAKSGRPAC